MDDSLLLETLEFGNELPLLNIEHLLAEEPPAQDNPLVSNGSTRRRRDERLLPPAERARLEKERAKNRRAAAKFREKQKEKQQALEAQHQAASEDLQRSRQQHASLQHHNSLLETLLAVRDSTVGVLERAKAEERLAGRKNGVHASAAMMMLQCGSMSDSGEEVQGEALPAWADRAVGDPGAEAAPSPGGVGGRGLETIRRLLGTSSSGSSSSPSGSSQWGSSIFRASDGERQLPPITYHHGWDEASDTDLRDLCRSVDPEVVAEVQRCSPEQFIRTWREFARISREVLLEYDVTGCEAVLGRLKPLMMEKSVLMTLMVHYNPECMRQLFASSADPGLSDEQQMEKWDAVVAAMEITPAQRKRYLELCATYEQQVQQARRERSRAVSAIGEASMGLSLVGLSEMMESYLQAWEGTACLSSYPDREFLALLELLSGMGQIFKPLQRVRAAAMAYPHFPDTLGVMEAIKRLPNS